MANDGIDLLKSIDTKLSALLALETHRVLIEDPNLASPRPRSIDRMLSDVGLSQAQIASLLGKTPQAVSQILARG